MASATRSLVLETFFPGVSALLLIGSFSSLSSSLPFPKIVDGRKQFYFDYTGKLFSSF